MRVKKSADEINGGFMKIINVGVDLHKTQFTICVICDEEVLEDGTKYPTSSEGFKSFDRSMQRLKKEDRTRIRLAIESTGNSRFFKQQMEDLGYEVFVVNTLKFKVVNMSTNKTDKHDAETLASFLQKDMLPQSNLCSAYNEGIRRVLKSRSLLVSDVIALKNQAHAVLLAYGIQTVPSQFQSKKGRQNIIKCVDEETGSILQAIFGTIDILINQIKQLESDLLRITVNDKNVRLLMTVPGIGIVNACTISSYTDDINRFEDYKHYSAFCGIVPWVQSSNTTSYYGRITKRGPQELRTALVQCVVAMIRMPDKCMNTNLIKNYHLLKEQKNSGKAIIATARRLSRIIYTMLSRQIPFNVNLA